MSVMNGSTLEFEIFERNGQVKAIVTRKGDYNDIAYIEPDGNVLWSYGGEKILDSAKARNDMLTIMEHIRIMNGYKAA